MAATIARRKTAAAPRPATSRPKTTRPAAGDRRDAAPARTTAQKINRKLDAAPDRIDIRDWIYQPSLQPLPDVVINCSAVPQILDQGNEGACTGFALAAVINFQLARRSLITAQDSSRLVSPRMIYEMARHYDEWPGEAYEGSSARGAMKGWVSHGVTRSSLWPAKLKGSGNLTETMARDALRTPGGAYYRVVHRNVRDMHAAIAETGVLYATLMVHEGWDAPAGASVDIAYTHEGNSALLTLPIIQRKGRADGGHAVAIVGYTDAGFIIQNSWGPSWGHKGFALLPYEDWLLHATDCWVAQLGVPVVMNLWTDGAAETTAGIQRAGSAIPLAEIRPYVIDVGNNGLLSNSGEYWTTEEDIERMFDSIAEVSVKWKKPRVMLYLHGGLNNESAVARRVVAFKDTCLANEIYPVHVMWESGFFEALKSSVLDLFTNEDERSGANWLKEMRDGVVEAKDRTIELTAAKPGGALWREMTENARLASAKGGGMQVLARIVKAFVAQLPPARRKAWELHVVGHSAGSIFASHALDLLVNCGISLRSVQLMAPAIRVDDFKNTVMPVVASGRCPHPTMYIMSDVGERDDDVGPYGKSLLYLVSNAFEARRQTAILGMERFVSSGSSDPNKELVDRDVEAFFSKKVSGLPSLVIAGKDISDASSASQSTSNSHGGFDNDTKTMNSVLYRILGAAPSRPFTDRDLQFD
ncbi:MAG: C1 family peptidase [Usitatibacter sp.]